MLSKKKLGISDIKVTSIGFERVPKADLYKVLD